MNKEELQKEAERRYNYKGYVNRKYSETIGKHDAFISGGEYANQLAQQEKEELVEALKEWKHILEAGLMYDKKGTIKELSELINKHEKE
jgi:hypothetical protein